MASCLEEYKGNLPVAPAGPIIYGVFAAISILLGLYVYYVRMRKPGPHTRTPDWGFGAAYVVSMLSGIGLFLSGPRVLIWALTRHAVNDSNALEMACLLSGTGLTSIIAPAFVAFMTLSIFAFNSCRSRAVASMVRVLEQAGALDCAGTASYPHEGAAKKKVRVAFLGAYRGIFVSQFTKAIQARAGSSEVSVSSYAVDCYGTLLCPEPASWILKNLSLTEGMAGTVQVVRVKDMVRLPFHDASLDVCCLPMGPYTPWLSQNRLSEEKKAERTRLLLQEALRVLKPGGLLITSVRVGKQSKGKWMEVMEGAFPAADGHTVEAMPAWIWFFFLPNSIVTARKSSAAAAGGGGASAGAAASAAAPLMMREQSLLEDSSRFAVISAAAGSAAAGPRRGNADAVHPSAISVTTVPSADRAASAELDGGAELQDNSALMLPAGKHWRLRDALTMANILLLYLPLIIVTHQYFEQLLVPSDIPAGDTLADLFLSQCVLIPLLLYFMWSDLTLTAKELEEDELVQMKRGANRLSKIYASSAAVSDESMNNTGSLDDESQVRLLAARAGVASRLSTRAPASSLLLDRAAEQRMVKGVFLRWLEEMKGFLLGITVVALLEWLPSWAVDEIMIRGLKITDMQKVELYGTLANVGITLLVVNLGTRLWGWYQKRRNEKLRREEAAAAAAGFADLEDAGERGEDSAGEPGVTAVEDLEEGYAAPAASDAASDADSAPLLSK